MDLGEKKKKKTWLWASQLQIMRTLKQPYWKVYTARNGGFETTAVQGALLEADLPAPVEPWPLS